MILAHRRKRLTRPCTEELRIAAAHQHGHAALSPHSRLLRVAAVDAACDASTLRGAQHLRDCRLNFRRGDALHP